MVAFNKINSFVEALAEKVHNLGADSIKAALTNTAPTAASTAWSVGAFPAPAAANGYPAGGLSITTTSSAQSSGTYKLVLADNTYTAAGGSLGPFQYVILYNDTSAGKEIIGWYTYPAPITLLDTEQFVLDFDGAGGVLTLV
jgi:hypothetical protein